MSCNWGGSPQRYDWNLVTDSVSQNFLAERNATFLRRELERRGYKIGTMRSVLPYMYEVLAGTVNSGYDPSVCLRKEAYPVSKLNKEFLDLVIPIFEGERSMQRRYAIDKKFGQQPLDIEVATDCKHQQLMYNNRW